uniref:Uncharacterized protein n=1 Tax=Euplotes crassus TaxID=5936 RepID=A0A7S3NV75_EUPCR|mmetsp:Transcript_34729/g.34378  ORF Transcript_34729/g.34378 Transcript_34729/m.34378 type:complete len:163 (+) Transcript_34729:92-580(+)
MKSKLLRRFGEPMDRRNRAIEEKKLAEIERQQDIIKKVKDKVIIGMEDPIQVSRRLRKKMKRASRRENRYFAPSNKTLQDELTRKKEGQIQKDGIYYIKNTQSKKISMPKLANLNPKIFELFTKKKIEERMEHRKGSEPEGETKEEPKQERHINIASTNPLS